MEITEARENHIPEIAGLWKEFMDFHKDIDPRFPMCKEAANRILERFIIGSSPLLYSNRKYLRTCTCFNLH